MKLYKSKTWIGWKNHNEANTRTSAQHLDIYRRQQNWVATSNFCANSSTKYRVKLSIPEFNSKMWCTHYHTKAIAFDRIVHYLCSVHSIRCYLRFQRKSISMISFSEPRNSFSSCLSNANRANVLYSFIFFSLISMQFLIYLNPFGWGLIWIRLKYVWNTV